MEEASRRRASALIGDRARSGSRGTTRVSNSRVLCYAVEKEKLLYWILLAEALRILPLPKFSGQGLLSSYFYLQVGKGLGFLFKFTRSFYLKSYSQGLES